MTFVYMVTVFIFIFIFVIMKIHIKDTKLLFSKLFADSTISNNRVFSSSGLQLEEQF